MALLICCALGTAAGKLCLVLPRLPFPFLLLGDPHTAFELSAGMLLTTSDRRVARRELANMSLEEKLKAFDRETR